MKKQLSDDFEFLNKFLISVFKCSYSITRFNERTH